MTDVWTSAAVIGRGVALTDWELLDPLVALAVAANIVWTGVQLMRRSVGRMPRPCPRKRKLLQVLEAQGAGIRSTRNLPGCRLAVVSVDILVPGADDAPPCGGGRRKRHPRNSGTIFTHSVLDDLLLPGSEIDR
jgi:hypothetical protein